MKTEDVIAAASLALFAVLALAYYWPEVAVVSDNLLGATDKERQDRDIDILARTLYGEARGQSIYERRAIAAVVLNRFESGKWFSAATIAETCLKPQQFSCWNGDDPNRVKILGVGVDNQVFRDCLEIAEDAAEGRLTDPTMGATHYHTIAAPDGASRWPPKWARTGIHTVDIGAHRFYRDVP